MMSNDDPRENDDYAENLPEIYTCPMPTCGGQFNSKGELMDHLEWDTYEEKSTGEEKMIEYYRQS